MKHSIFISYRRDDAEGEAGRLYDDLVRAFSEDSVFMDVAGIAPGLDFRKAIDDNVSGCGVFLAIIGAQWATITGADGQRRLDSADDFVRLEVASALNRNIAVIPVLVHEARMPHPDQLPDNIKDLAYRNSVEISHARWNSDVQLLVKALEQYMETPHATQNEPVHATVPVQLPPPVSPPTPTEAKKSNLPLMASAVAAGVAVLAAVLWFVVPHRASSAAPSAAALAPASATPKQAASVSTPVQEAVSPSAALAGMWRSNRAKQGGDVPVKLRITGSDPNYRVEVLGACPQGECSWGAQPMIFSAGLAKATWSPRVAPADVTKSRVATITLRPAGALLNMEIQNSFILADGTQKHNRTDFDFSREP